MKIMRRFMLALVACLFASVTVQAAGRRPSGPPAGSPFQPGAEAFRQAAQLKTVQGPQQSTWQKIKAAVANPVQTAKNIWSGTTTQPKQVHSGELSSAPAGGMVRSMQQQVRGQMTQPAAPVTTKGLGYYVQQPFQAAKTAAQSAYQKVTTPSGPARYTPAVGEQPQKPQYSTVQKVLSPVRYYQDSKAYSADKKTAQQQTANLQGEMKAKGQLLTPEETAKRTLMQKAQEAATAAGSKVASGAQFVGGQVRQAATATGQAVGQAGQWVQQQVRPARRENVAAPTPLVPGAPGTVTGRMQTPTGQYVDVTRRQTPAVGPVQPASPPQPEPITQKSLEAREKDVQKLMAQSNQTNKEALKDPYNQEKQAAAQAAQDTAFAARTQLTQDKKAFAAQTGATPTRPAAQIPAPSPEQQRITEQNRGILQEALSNPLGRYATQPAPSQQRQPLPIPPVGPGKPSTFIPQSRPVQQDVAHATNF
ncbi:hypothetical protein K2X40_01745 [Candidatus Babeliales bacterium]|nr:hypothetical protein [Candidatus Babeliales bacterium]